MRQRRLATEPGSALGRRGPDRRRGRSSGAVMAVTRSGGAGCRRTPRPASQKFTELVATAIANAESREARAVLTDEQAALRRVATLVAQGASPRGSLRGRRRGGRPPVTRRKRHDGSLRTRRQRHHGGLVEHHRGCVSYRQAVADRGHERRVDGAPDGPGRSYRRLLGCHRPDRRRRAGGGHQVGGWKPDRRRRPVSGAS